MEGDKRLELSYAEGARERVLVEEMANAAGCGMIDGCGRVNCNKHTAMYVLLLLPSIISHNVSSIFSAKRGTFRVVVCVSHGHHQYLRLRVPVAVQR